MSDDPFLADDGYPSEAELATISNWDALKRQDAEDLMDYIRARWRFADCGYWDEVIHDIDGKATRCYSISTGGWSGNEELVGALQDNTMFWILRWESSKRGGHYEFRIV